MVRPGLINLDFADVRAVMDEMGKAMMGTERGEDRAKPPKKPLPPIVGRNQPTWRTGRLINITVVMI